MQLDSTRIAVQERGFLDILDLSLRVLRIDGGRLILLLAIGALPMIAINHLLIGWMMSGDSGETFLYADEAGSIARYVWDMSLLIMIEGPFATILLTAYLGQAMFVERPALRPILTDVGRMFARVAWCQLFLRGVLPAWFLMQSLDRHGDFDPNIEISLMGLLSIYVIGLRFVRPFINEIVLLERNPLLGSNTLTVGRRSAQLHGPSTGELFFRGLVTGLIAILLTMAVFGTFWFMLGVFLNSWRAGPLFIGMMFPLSMWFVVGFLTVTRYLNYLDLRIRQEGWEIELRVRAEATRLAGGLT